MSETKENAITKQNVCNSYDLTACGSSIVVKTSTVTAYHLGAHLLKIS